MTIPFWGIRVWAYCIGELQNSPDPEEIPAKQYAWKLLRKAHGIDFGGYACVKEISFRVTMKLLIT